MYEKFKKWLESSSTQPFTSRTDGLYDCVFIKVRKSASFDYIFCQKNWKESSLATDDFKFAGAYCLKDKKIYLASYDLIRRMGSNEELSARTDEMLKKQMVQKVREKVESVINNDRSNLKITELSDTWNIMDLENAKSYRAANKARAHFLADEPFDSLGTFRCEYSFEEWQGDNVLRYILGPDEFAEDEANTYINEHQEDMLFRFMYNDLLAKEYEAIVSNPTNPVHTVKKIMTAVNRVDAKTVNVTILKDGREFTFKTNTDPLRRDCTSDYPDWHMAAADRRLYKSIFGSKNYTPQDIVRITYGRKVLYEAEN